MSRIRSALLVLLAFVVVAPAAAQTDWAVADRKDEQIVSLVDKLTPFLEKVDGGTSAEGVILYSQTLVKVDGKVHEQCRNQVYLVRDLEAFPDRLLMPTVGRLERVSRAKAFVLRGDAIVARFEATFEEGPEEIGRDRAVFDWSAVQSGDVIGWSIVQSQDGPFGVIGMRLADVFPSVYLAASVAGGEEFAYEVKRWGIGADDLQIKRPDQRDGRAVNVKLNARVRPAYADTPEDWPFPQDYPHAMIALSEVYFEPENGGGFVRSGWTQTTGWNQVAIGSAAGIPALADQVGGLDITLSAITTGKTTAHEKAAAITDWVRKTIQREEGDLINERARREDLAAVVKAKAGTKTEQFLLAAVMMHKADVPFVVANFRDPAFGELDERWESQIQMTDAVIRVEEEGVVRYYAPACAECEPGTYPAGWAGAEMLVYDLDLKTKAEEYQEKLQQEAVASGAIDIGRIQSEIAAKDWTRFETLAAPQ